MGKAILSRPTITIADLLDLQQLLWRRARGGARVDCNWREFLWAWRPISPHHEAAVLTSGGF
jgi:hypothetical protein